VPVRDGARAVVPGIGQVHPGQASTATGIVRGLGAHVRWSYPHDARAHELVHLARRDPARYGPDLVLYTHAPERYAELERVRRLPSHAWERPMVEEVFQRTHERRGPELVRRYGHLPLPDRVIIGLAAPSGAEEYVAKALEAHRLHRHYPARVGLPHLIRGWTPAERARLSAALLPGGAEPPIEVFRSIRADQRGLMPAHRRELLTALRSHWLVGAPALIPMWTAFTEGLSPEQIEGLRLALVEQRDVEAILAEIEAQNADTREAAVEAAMERWLAEHEANRADAPLDAVVALEGNEGPDDECDESDEDAGAVRGGARGFGGRGGVRGLGGRFGWRRSRPWGPWGWGGGWWGGPWGWPVWTFLPEEVLFLDEGDDDETGATPGLKPGVSREAGAPQAKVAAVAPVRAPAPGAYAADGVLPFRHLVQGFGREGREALHRAWAAGNPWPAYQEIMARRGEAAKRARELDFIARCEELGCEVPGTCHIDPEKIVLFGDLGEHFTPEQWARLAQALTEGAVDPLDVWREIELENLTEAKAIRGPAFLRHFGSWGRAPRYSPAEWETMLTDAAPSLMDAAGLEDVVGALGSIGSAFGGGDGGGSSAMSQVFGGGGDGGGDNVGQAIGAGVRLAGGVARAVSQLTGRPAARPMPGPPPGALPPPGAPPAPRSHRAAPARPVRPGPSLAQVVAEWTPALVPAVLPNRGSEPGSWWEELTGGMGLDERATAELSEAIKRDGPQGTPEILALYEHLLERPLLAQQHGRIRHFARLVTAAQQVAGKAFDPATLPGNPFEVIAQHTPKWPLIVERLKSGNNPVGLFRRAEAARVSTLLHHDLPHRMMAFLRAGWKKTGLLGAPAQPGKQPEQPGTTEPEQPEEHHDTSGVDDVLAAIFSGGISEIPRAVAASGSPQVGAWRREYGERFWLHPHWRRRWLPTWERRRRWREMSGPETGEHQATAEAVEPVVAGEVRWRPRPFYHLTFGRPMTDLELYRLLFVVPELRAHPDKVLSEMAGRQGQAREVEGVDALTGEYVALPGEGPEEIAAKLVGDPSRAHELAAANPAKRPEDPRVRLPPDWFGWIPYQVPVEDVEACLGEAGAPFLRRTPLPRRRSMGRLGASSYGRGPRGRMDGYGPGDPGMGAAAMGPGGSVAPSDDAGPADDEGDESSGLWEDWVDLNTRAAESIRGLFSRPETAPASAVGTEPEPEAEPRPDPDPSAPSPHVVADRPRQATTRTTYTVVAGDFPLGIARKLGAAKRVHWFAELVTANHHKALTKGGFARLYGGEVLNVPDAWTRAQGEAGEAGELGWRELVHHARLHHRPAHASRVLCVLEAGIPVRVLECWAGWCRVHCEPDGEPCTGWVRRMFIGGGDIGVELDAGDIEPALRENTTQRTYAVVKGDSMIAIAKKFKAANRPHWYAELRDANPQKEVATKDGKQIGWKRLQPGEIVNIPDVWAADVPEARPAPGAKPTPAGTKGLDGFPKVGPAKPAPHAPPGTVPVAASVDPGTVQRVQGYLIAWGRAHPDDISPKDFGAQAADIPGPMSTDTLGVMAPRTQAAIASFQRWANKQAGHYPLDERTDWLRQDGVLDPPTIAAIDSWAVRTLSDLPARPPVVPVSGGSMPHAAEPLAPIVGEALRAGAEALRAVAEGRKPARPKGAPPAAPAPAPTPSPASTDPFKGAAEVVLGALKDRLPAELPPPAPAPPAAPAPAPPAPSAPPSEIERMHRRLHEEILRMGAPGAPGLPSGAPHGPPAPPAVPASLQMSPRGRPPRRPEGAPPAPERSADAELPPEAPSSPEGAPATKGGDAAPAVAGLVLGGLMLGPIGAAVGLGLGLLAGESEAPKGPPPPRSPEERA
jgi:hypothetical protein